MARQMKLDAQPQQADVAAREADRVALTLTLYWCATLKRWVTIPARDD